MKENIRTLLLGGAIFCFSGCSLSLTTQELHDGWVRKQEMEIGKSMYSLRMKNLNKYNLLEGITLPSGNTENKYRLDINGPRKSCKFFYEYKPASGLIVNFRYEDDDPYACRGTGA